MTKVEKRELIELKVQELFHNDKSATVDSVSSELYLSFSTQIKITEISQLVRDIALSHKLIKTRAQIRTEVSKFIDAQFDDVSWNIDYSELANRIDTVQYQFRNDDISEAFIRGFFKSLAIKQACELPKKPRSLSKLTWKQILVQEIKIDPEISLEELAQKVLPSVKALSNAEYYVKEFAWMLKAMFDQD